MSVDKLVDSTQLDSDLTSVANAIRTKGGTSSQLAFPSGFVSAINAIPTGGGSGTTIVASGEFVGASSSGRQTIVIGQKMAKTDFYFVAKAKNGEEFPYNSQYKFIVFFSLCTKDTGSYTFQTSGDATYVPSFAVDENNSGTITSRNSIKMVEAEYIRSGSVNMISANTFALGTGANGFYIYMGHSNTVYEFTTGVDYEYRVVYFGTDPTNDIVELS